MIIVTHRAGRGHRLRRALAAMAGAAAGEIGKQQVGGGIGSLGAVAADAGLRRMGAMVEPAMVHIAQREGDRPDPEVERTGRRRFDLVAIVAGAAAREDGADCALRAGRRDGAVELDARAGRLALPRRTPRRRAEARRRPWPAAAVEIAQVGDDLLGLAVAEGPQSAADAV